LEKAKSMQVQPACSHKVSLSKNLYRHIYLLAAQSWPWSFYDVVQVSIFAKKDPAITLLVVSRITVTINSSMQDKSIFYPAIIYAPVLIYVHEDEKFVFLYAHVHVNHTQV
jgi:hypothetical protein